METRWPLSSSKTHAERLCNLGQAFALCGMRVAPGRPAFKFVQHLRPGLGTRLRGKLIPQVFHQLKAFKFAKVFNGL